MSAPALWCIERPLSARSPLLVNVPHAGTYVPRAIAQTLTPAGIAVPDTDWYVDKLYEFVPAVGATLMVATHSRIVVDLNRNPSGDALYPGTSNTEICPTATFSEQAIYLPGLAPDVAGIATRVEHYWAPYHHQLQTEIERIKSEHGYCILLDGHSIVSLAPRFFAGRLPDLNLGSADGNSCDPALARAAIEVLSQADGFTAVHNGRFKGGYITRYYGVPAANVHALQLEMTQRCYMNETDSRQFDGVSAAALTNVLHKLVGTLLAWRPALGIATKK